MFSLLENDLGYLRCGWTIPKYVGTAVTRNRIRRWCREFFSSARKQSWDPSIDLNVVLRRNEKDFFKQLSFDEFNQNLEKGVRKVRDLKQK
jgi:ribonuclease P protein component